MGTAANKFLRGNRLQLDLSRPVAISMRLTTSFASACHDKEGWVGSVHASSVTAR